MDEELEGQALVLGDGGKQFSKLASCESPPRRGRILVAWGDDPYPGQLGVGEGPIASSTPLDVCADAVCVSTLSGVTSVVAGAYQTCAVTAAAGIKCWGKNTSGQLGDGNAPTDSDTPGDVCADAACASTLSGVTSVSAGNHTCAVTDTGVQCWGSNSNGQLGDGTTISSDTPVNVSRLGFGVGGIAKLPGVAASPAETSGLSGMNTTALAAIGATIASGILLAAGGALHAVRRRRLAQK